MRSKTPRRLDDCGPRSITDKLAPIYETIARVKAELPPSVALFGFCGAPWTVATYMIAGCGTPDQSPARLFAYRHPEAFAKLIDMLIEASASYLVRQFAAGVDAVQIFDTWAGVLPAEEFRKWCIEPTARIVASVREQFPAARIIGFPRGAGTELAALSRSCAGRCGGARLDDGACVLRAIKSSRCGPFKAISIRWCCSPAARRSIVGSTPSSKRSGNTPFIFNLGHGILPDTPIAHVERLIARVRNDV